MWFLAQHQWVPVGNLVSQSSGKHHPQVCVHIKVWGALPYVPLTATTLSSHSFAPLPLLRSSLQYCFLSEFLSWPHQFDLLCDFSHGTLFFFSKAHLKSMIKPSFECLNISLMSVPPLDWKPQEGGDPNSGCEKGMKCTGCCFQEGAVERGKGTLEVIWWERTEPITMQTRDGAAWKVMVMSS